MAEKTDYIFRYWFYDEDGRCVRNGYTLHKAYRAGVAIAEASCIIDQMPEYYSMRLTVDVRSVAEFLAALDALQPADGSREE